MINNENNMPQSKHVGKNISDKYGNDKFIKMISFNDNTLNTHYIH